MDRRAVLVGSVGLAMGAGLGGCWTPRGEAPMLGGDSSAALIDAHCHLFNGSDLPVGRFLRTVLLRLYPDGALALGIPDADGVDALLDFLAWLMGRSRAPTAAEEIAVLAGRARPRLENADPAGNDQLMIEGVSEYLLGGAPALTGARAAGAAQVRAAILRTGGVREPALAPLTPAQARVFAGQAYHADTALGRLLRWVGLFTRYRYALADSLDAHHRGEGFAPALLSPAIVDYDNWLGEYVDRSPLPEQVSVMGRLARRKIGAVVHGYVGFDPLRQAFWTERARVSGPARWRAPFDPMALVRRAVLEEGFVGVKLYPPMGFRPFGNAGADQDYPPQVKADWAAGRASLDAALDLALAGVFDFCLANEACVMAHAADSVEAGDGYGRRADPAFWLPVFARWPGLRVMLAHFGGFTYRSAKPQGPNLPEASWEWTLGAWLADCHADAPVFADLSYLSEIAHEDAAARVRRAAIFRRWIDHFDPDCRHLVFGTDWIMLGRDGAYEGHDGRLRDFLKDACGLNADQLHGIFYGNAVRFLGLQPGDRTRARLEALYRASGVPLSRLPGVIA